MLFAICVLAPWAFLLALLAWQARLIRRLPALNLRASASGAGKLSFGVLAIGAILGALWFAAFPPAFAAVSTLALGFGLALYKTLAIDLWLVSRVANLVPKGELDRAVHTANLATMLVRRHGATVVTANIVRALAVTVASAGRHDAAAAMLEKLARLRFPVDVLAWAVALDLAMYRIALGRCDEARRALVECETRWTVPTEDSRNRLLLLDARIDAATGAPERALERVGTREGTEWDYVRAHAHAAAGREQDAIQILERLLVQKGGEEHLRAMAARGGPAAALARSMLENAAGPYR